MNRKCIDCRAPMEEQLPADQFLCPVCNSLLDKLRVAIPSIQVPFAQRLKAYVGGAILSACLGAVITVVFLLCTDGLTTAHVRGYAVALRGVLINAIYF